MAENEITWEEYVRSEVKTLLDLYLPQSESGDVGIQYKKTVKEVYESGPVYEEVKADAVCVSLIFNFSKPVDIVNS
jgi:hypothetical protein